MTDRQTVTDLRPRPDGTIRVWLDGEFAFALPAEEAVRAKLARGLALEENALARLRALADTAAVRRRLDRLLARRDYARGELRRKLREYPAELAEAILADYETRGLIDDRRFAVAFLADRMRFKPSGRIKLAADLRKHGVGAALIGELLPRSGEDDLAAARQAWAAVARRWRGLAREVRARRAAGFLARRGFSAGVIAKLLREAGESGAGDESP